MENIKTVDDMRTVEKVEEEELDYIFLVDKSIPENKNQIVGLILPNDTQVSEGDKFNVKTDIGMIGLPEGSQITVSKVANQNDGVYFYFDCDFKSMEPLEEYQEPTIIYAFALVKSIESGSLKKVE